MPPFVPPLVPKSYKEFDLADPGRDGTALALKGARGGPMELGRFSLSLTIAGIVTLMAASMLIWLLLYAPVALAGAVDHGDLAAVAEAIGTALLKTVAALFRYL